MVPGPPSTGVAIAMDGGTLISLNPLTRLPGYPVTFKLVGTSEGNAPSSAHRLMDSRLMDSRLMDREKPAVFFEVWVFLLVVHEE